MFVDTRRTESDQSLGTEIRRLRKRASYGLREFADRVDISPGHLADIESGRRTPSDCVMERIAHDLEKVGATLDRLRLLKPTLEPELQQWISASPHLMRLLRTMKESGKPIAGFLAANSAASPTFDPRSPAHPPG